MTPGRASGCASGHGLGGCTTAGGRSHDSGGHGHRDGHGGGHAEFEARVEVSVKSELQSGPLHGFLRQVVLVMPLPVVVGALAKSSES